MLHPCTNSLCTAPVFFRSFSAASRACASCLRVELRAKGSKDRRLLVRAARVQGLTWVITVASYTSLPCWRGVVLGHHPLKRILRSSLSAASRVESQR